MKSIFSLAIIAVMVGVSYCARAAEPPVFCDVDPNRDDESGGYISITTASMEKDQPGACSMTDAFQIIDDGGNFGTNKCGNVTPSPDTLVTINGRGMTFTPTEELTLSNNGARVYNATFDGEGATRIFRATSDDALLMLDTISVVDGKAPGSEGGGGVLVESGARLIVRNTRFQNNQASTGGAIMHQSYGEMDIYHSYFLSNEATAGIGGAIRVSMSDAGFVHHSRLEGNKASLGGGAIYNEDAVLDIVNSYIEDNVAGSDGGGVHAAGDTTIACTRIAGNKTLAGDGGGLFTTPAGGQTFVIETAIEGNKAGGDQWGRGGGVYIGDDTTIRNGSISNNQAYKGGGGIYVHESAADDPIHIENVTLATNEVLDGSGGAMNITGWSTAQITDDPESPFGKYYSFRILNSTIVGNKSDDAQLYFRDDGYKTFGEVLFLNNVVEASGEGAGTASCAGLVQRLLAALPSDPAATNNAEWPVASCGPGFQTTTALGAVTMGGRFSQAYAETMLADPGQVDACTVIEDLDQFLRPAPCRLGAVRAGEAPLTPDPQAPGMLIFQ